MKKIALLCFLSTTLFNFAHSQPVVFDWAQSAGGKSTYEGVVSIARDASGNLYLAGEFSGTRDFGCALLVAQGASDVFVAKYSASGGCLWAVSGGASFSSAYAGKLVVNGGEVFLVGKFSNILNFGGNTVSSAGNYDIFIAALSIINGSGSWLSRAGGTSADAGLGIAPVTGGGVYICGNFTGTALFDGIPVFSGSIIDDDIFYARYTSAGSCMWVKRAGSPTGYDYAHSIKEVAGGNILMTGSYEGTVQFGTGPSQTSVGFSDIFILSANSNGDVLGARSGGGPNNDIGYDIDTDPSGNIYMTGQIYSSATFGSVSINTNMNLNVVVAKFNSSGICQWAATAGNTLDDIGFGISTDAFGSSYVTGYINGDGFFGSTYVSGVQTQDVFVAKYSTSGQLMWVTKIGGPNYDRGKAILKDFTGGWCFVAGDFTDTAPFGTTTLLTDPGNSASFISRIGGGTVSVDELSDAPFNLFPNPSAENVTVNFSNVKDAIFTIELLDVEGKLLQTYTLNQADAENGFEINLKEFSSGNYMMKVNTSTGDFTRRLVIAK